MNSIFIDDPHHLPDPRVRSPKSGFTEYFGVRRRSALWALLVIIIIIITSVRKYCDRVCWFVRCFVRSLTFLAEYLENSWSQRADSNKPPAGNGIWRWRIEWSHD